VAWVRETFGRALGEVGDLRRTLGTAGGRNGWPGCGRPSVVRSARSETFAEHWARAADPTGGVGLETFGRADGDDPSGARDPRRTLGGEHE
jgi:hypothetical protein